MTDRGHSTSNPSKIQLRMAWRLVLSLFGHLTVLFFLAVYLISSLNHVRLYTPQAQTEEAQVESLSTIPALLHAMDAERRVYLRTFDPRDLTIYSGMRDSIETKLNQLRTPVVLGELENRRRALVQQWITQVGDVAFNHGKSANVLELDEASARLLDEIKDVTDRVRIEEKAKLADIMSHEAKDASDRVTLMWVLVGLVSFTTIVIQLALANSIVGPIQNLLGVVQRLRRGDYTARAKLTSGDEIQTLGETLNAMSENILRSQKELQEKNERLSIQQEALRYANTNLEMNVELKTKELEDKNVKLNEANRLKDEFLATLSHELRTPLTPILSCAQLLSSSTELGPDDLKSVQVIDRNVRALSRMIDELLDLSVVTNRKLRLVRERTELNEWTRSTIESVRPVWERKEMDVTFIPEEKPVELEIDRVRLAQVVTNLMTNAIKYTDAKGRITVRITAREDGVRIAVSDTGVGLTHEEIGRIFELFHQSRTPHMQSIGGLGIGLSVARSLAELHGGGLLAESAGPGKGATFTLWLPLLNESRAVDFSVPSLTPLPDVVDRRLLRGRRILLVEDSDDTRDALERIFQRRACEVTTAATGEEALEKVKHAPPEIIISDIGLPGISGIEFMAKLRQYPEWKGVVAVALSGLGREKDIRGAIEAGFDAHLLKPVDMVVLDRTLAELLQKRAQAK